jgi:hypothetical protein
LDAAVAAAAAAASCCACQCTLCSSGSYSTSSDTACAGPSCGFSSTTRRWMAASSCVPPAYALRAPRLPLGGPPDRAPSGSGHCVSMWRTACACCQPYMATHRVGRIKPAAATPCLQQITCPRPALQQQHPAPAAGHLITLNWPTDTADRNGRGAVPC